MDGDPFEAMFLPERHVGRLVETPTEMIRSLQTFLDLDGRVDLTNLIPDRRIMVSGYDFLQDASRVVRDRWKVFFGVPTDGPPSDVPIGARLISDDSDGVVRPRSTCEMKPTDRCALSATSCIVSPSALRRPRRRTPRLDGWRSASMRRSRSIGHGRDEGRRILVLLKKRPGDNNLEQRRRSVTGLAAHGKAPPVRLSLVHLAAPVGR